MKILFLSPTVPFPLTDGGRIRVFNLLKQIAAKSDVTLLALETQPTDADGVAAVTAVRRSGSPRPQRTDTPTRIVRYTCQRFPQTTTYHRCTLRATCLSSEI